MNPLQTKRGQAILSSFATDIAELVREALLDELENRIAEHSTHQALPASASKRLTSKAQPKTLKPRAKINAKPSVPELAETGT